MENIFYIGTAAWTLPKGYRDEFGEGASQLERYATRLLGVEINTSFYRDHKPETYVRWAESVPQGFRFSVKLSKIFTHEYGLRRGEKDLTSNLSDILGLGEKLGAILVQLPPKLTFDETTASNFFAEIRSSYSGPLVLEPRNISWDGERARLLATRFNVSRVISDPQPYFSRTLERSDFADVVYMRLHGSPDMYRSNYETDRLKVYVEILKEYAAQGLCTWCIFDNTTFGHATGNALIMNSLLKEGGDFVGDEFARRLTEVQTVGQQSLD